MISRTWFAGVAMLSSLGMFVPSRVLAQHGPGRHGPDSALVYDTNSEETFKGIVTEVKMGRSALYWLSQIHTLGLGHKGEQEKQLVMKTDTDTVEIHLGPTAFLTERKMDIGKGDALEVTGSHATIARAQGRQRVRRTPARCDGNVLCTRGRAHAGREWQASPVETRNGHEHPPDGPRHSPRGAERRKGARHLGAGRGDCARDRSLEISVTEFRYALRRDGTGPMRVVAPDAAHERHRLTGRSYGQRHASGRVADAESRSRAGSRSR